MITLTDEENRMILEMIFEDANKRKQDLPHQSRMAREMPKEIEALLRHIADNDRNILLTFVAVVFYAGISKSSFRYLLSILGAAAAIGTEHPDVIKELCEQEVSIRLPHLLACLEDVLQNTLDGVLMNDEPAGNC